MAETPQQFLDPTLSAEERFSALSALDRGTVLALEYLLGHVRSYHELLEEELEDRPAAVRYLEACRGAVAAGLRWSKLFCSSVRCNLGFEALDVQLLLSGAVSRCQKILGDKREIQFEGVEEVIVEGSMFQLQDLFMKGMISFLDLVMLDEGCLTVASRVRSLSQAFLGLMRSRCAEGDYLMVTYAVRGVTYDPDKQEPFLDALIPELARDGNSHELDFLHVYGILRHHGGDAFIQKDAERIGALTFALPVQQKREDMQAPHNIEDESLRGTETILLVDDEDMVWDVIIDMLQELGYAVILAGNGREAVEIYRENPGQIDLVILDMVMPEMSGYEAFFELKEIDAGVRVLLSSGYVSEDDARSVLDAGALGFLQKPYRMVDLARRVRQIIDREK